MSRRLSSPLRLLALLTGLVLLAGSALLLSPDGWLAARLPADTPTASLNASILSEMRLLALLTGAALLLAALAGSRLGNLLHRLAGPLVALDAWLAAGRRWRVAVFAAAALAALLLASYSIARHNAFNSKAYDLGLHAQVIWNTGHGRLFASSVEVDNYLGDHVSPIILLLAPLYRLWPDPRSLLIVQALALAAGALPLAAMTRRLLLPPWPGGAHLLAMLLALAYLVAPALGFTNRFEFHEEVLAVPLLLLAFWWLENERPWPMSLALLLAALCKEDVGLTVAAFGLWAAWRKPRLKAFGLAWLAIGLAWSLLALLVIIPAFRGAPADTLDRYAWLGRTPSAALTTLVTRPDRVLAHVLGDPRRFWFLFKLLLPTGFLALLSPALLIALPGVLINWLAANLYQATFYFHYAAVSIPVVFAAAAYGMERVGQREGRGRREKRETQEGREEKGEAEEESEGREATPDATALAQKTDKPMRVDAPTPHRLPALVVWLVLCVTLSVSFDQFWQRDLGVAAWENYGVARQINPTPFHAAAALLPADGVVATTEAYAPHLANRAGLHLLHDPRIGEVVDRLEWVLVDLSDHRYGVNPRLYYALLRWVAERRSLAVCFFDQDVVLLGPGCRNPQAEAAYRARLAALQSAAAPTPLDAQLIEALGRRFFEP